MKDGNQDLRECTWLVIHMICSQTKDSLKRVDTISGDGDSLSDIFALAQRMLDTLNGLGERVVRPERVQGTGLCGKVPKLGSDPVVPNTRSVGSGLMKENPNVAKWDGSPGMEALRAGRALLSLQGEKRVLKRPQVRRSTKLHFTFLGGCWFWSHLSMQIVHPPRKQH